MLICYLAIDQDLAHKRRGWSKGDEDHCACTICSEFCAYKVMTWARSKVAPFAPPKTKRKGPPCNQVGLFSICYAVPAGTDLPVAETFVSLHINV
jgi:hypothetical protein